MGTYCIIYDLIMPHYSSTELHIKLCIYCKLEVCNKQCPSISVVHARKSVTFSCSFTFFMSSLLKSSLIL